MNPNNIEEILQRYGEDKRQQQLLSDRLRHMARKQRRIGGTVCATLLLVGVVTTANLISTLQSTAPMLASSQQHTVTERTGLPMQSTAAKKAILHQTTAPSTMIDHQLSFITPLPEADTTATVGVAMQQAVTADTAPQALMPELLAEQMNLTPVAYDSYNNIYTPVEKENRLRFTSSINASTVSGANFGYAKETEEQSLIAGKSFSTIDPAFSLSANIGASYTVVTNHSFQLDIGLSICGHTQQGTVNDYIVSENSSESFVSQQYAITIIPDGQYHYNSFYLFANLPITLNFYPSGNDKTGWSLNITPAHSIVNSLPLGTTGSGQYDLNPWKLTVGAGIVFPHKLIRRLGITANLLPLYTTNPIHEFGVEIGF